MAGYANDEDKTPEIALLNCCHTISGIITQQHGNRKYLASALLDDLKYIHSFLLKEVSMSFGCRSDEKGKSDLHREVAYGILPELVSHVLKLDAQADGDFVKMYTMVIDIFCYLIAVCSVELMAFLFSTFASLLLYFNEKKPLSCTSELRTAVMYKLCYYMFPLCFTHPRSEGAFCHAMVPAILGSVLDTCSGEDMKWCTQMLDILMSSKKDVCLDIITLISSGTKRVRKQAEKILLHYWLTPNEGRNGEEILKAWQLEKCCSCHRMADLVCVNPACGIHKRTEDEGFYFCKFCHANCSCEQMFPIAKPIGFENRLSGSCQLGLDNCGGTAVLACFHPDCVSLVKKTANQPFVRMCNECVASCHVNDNCDHIFQDGLQCPWTCQNRVMSITLLGALSKLLDDELAAYQSKSKENQSIDYDSTAAVLLLDQYCHCPVHELDDDMHNWMVHLVSLVLNWLYEIINQQWFAAMENKIVPWLVGVLHQEAEYVAEAVLPNLPEYAQVGRLWNSTHSMVERREHTLQIIKMLQSKILTGSKADRFYQVFDTIMPFWLKELSGSPDQLESLKDYFKKLFEVNKDDDTERKRKFDFVKIAFNDQDVQKTKEALCWLQALTRMDIGIPFLKDMIQQAAQKQSLKKLSSFDVKASSRHISAVPYRRSSWSDSEHSDASSVSGLMTHSSVEYAGDILEVDSTLTRCILMLDVWLSQIKLVNKDFSMFQFLDIQGIVLCMLKESHNWGSYHKHNCPSEICLLCYAIVLWFNLANLIFEEYTVALMQFPDDDEETVQTLPRPSRTARPSRTSFFSKFFPVRRTTAQEHYSPESIHYSPDSRPSIASSSGSVNEQSSLGIPSSPVNEKPQMCRRERKMARMDTHTNYTLVSQSLQAKKKADSTGTLYKIFQECLKWWRPLTFIPEATYYIILFITTLFRNNKLLHDVTSYSTCITDVEKLITNLWNSLICEYTYLAKAAVSLLCECLEFLVIPNMDLQQIKFRSMVDSKFEQDSYTKRFEVVEKAFLIIQFTEDMKKLSCQTQLSLSHVFCHLVGSLQDSSSHVATRAQYCLRSLKQSALLAIQDAMSSSFNKYANHRSQILMTMAIINSHLPDCNIPNSPIRFLVELEPYLELLKECYTDIRKRKKGKTEERLSMASHSVEVINRHLNSNTSNAAILQQMLALLLQILADRRFNKTNLLDEPIELPVTTSAEKGLTIIMEFFRLIVCQYFVPLPVKLRESHFFGTYLRNIHQVLDINTAFGNSPEVLSFNLRLLVFSACSSYDECQFSAERLRQKTTSLALLDPSLCLAWLKVFFVICYKYVDQILESEEKEKLQDGVLACVVITLKTLEKSPHHCIPPPQQKLHSCSIQEHTIFLSSAATSRNPSVVSMDSGSTSTTVPSSRQVDTNKCPLCNDAIITVHGEEIITQCVVTLSTALHHMPVLTLRYLIDSINVLARVAVPDSFSWDNTSRSKDQAAISASTTAKQYLKCLLTQHGDRKLFLYLFKYCDSKALMQAIFSSLPLPVVEQENSTNLGEGEDSSNKNVKAILNQISPVQYFLEDLPEEPNILRRSNVIINLSSYLHLIKDSNGRKSLVSLVPQFEFFFEKVKQLPKTVDVEAYNALIKIMILVTKVLNEYPPKHGLIQQSLLFQQFASYHSTILLMGFKYTLVPLHGLVVLFSSWYHLLESHSMSFTNLDNMILAMNNELVQVLKLKLPNMPGNFITLVKFFILCFHGNIGYINDIFNDGKTIFCRDLHESPFFNHIATILCHQMTLPECLGFLCCRLNWVHVYEFKLHVAKLLVTNLCSGIPSKDIFGRLQQIDAILSASPSEDRAVHSVLKTSTSFLVALGWCMVGAMKLTAIRQIFNKQLAEAATVWEADDISGFLYRIWIRDPLNGVNDVVNSTLNLIVKNCNVAGLDKDAKNVFLFLEIWTVYLEVVLPKGEDNTFVVIQVWSNVIKQISSIPMLETAVSILHHLNKAVAHIKRADLFLTTKVTPFWRETRKMGDKAQYCTELWRDVGDAETTIDTGFNAPGGEITVDQSQKQTNCCSGQRGLDTWYNCVLQRLSNMDTDYRSEIMGQ